MSSTVLCSALLVVLAASLVSAESNSLLKNKDRLVLLDSRSAIPVSTFESNPDLSDTLLASVQGPFNAAFEGNLLKVARETFYATGAGIFPALSIDDTTDNTLNEVSTVYTRPNVGLSNGVFSGAPGRPYGVLSTYEASPLAPRVAFLPHTFKIEFHWHDANGVLDQTPTFVYDMATIDPAFYNATIAYNGIAGISNDGKYLLLTWGVATPGLIVISPFLPPITQRLVGQKYGLFEIMVDTDGRPVDLVKRAEIPTAPTNFENLYSFPQGMTMWADDNDSSKYSIFVAENSWNLTNPLGYTAQASLYRFDANSNELVFKNSEWVPQYIQGFDVDEENNRAYVITNAVSDDGVSVNQNARAPYNNPAADKSDELRSFGLTTDSITYIAGADLNMDGIQIRSSPDGKDLVVTAAPALFNDLFPALFGSLTPFSRRYAPTSVLHYSVSGGQVQLQSVSSAAPLSFGIVYDATGERVAVCGTSTYETQGGAQTGRKGLQLYKIEK